MRTLTSFLALVALSQDLPAQQSLIVTPTTLNGWVVTGTDYTALSNLTDLALPRGAQLARSFLATEVSVKISTSPVVGGTAADWPVIELGNCALVFARNENGGKLTFIAGDNQPIDLPFSYSLDAAGRSIEPLLIELSRKGTSASVAVAGQTMQFPAGPLSGQELEVIASAGNADAWDFELLEVVVGALPANQDSAANPTVGFSGKSGRADGSEKTAGTSLISSPQADAANRGDLSSKAATDGNAKADSASVGLEIFTPPAVRHGRVDAVRSALSAQKSN